MRERGCWGSEEIDEVAPAHQVILPHPPAGRRAGTLRHRFVGTMAPEDRAGRGTIVFLLGRELTRSEDFTFISEVVSEKPCLSMANCAHEDSGHDEATLHHDAISGVTLAYPGLAAVKSLETWFKANSDANLRADAEKALHSARESQSGLVANHAAGISVPRLH